MLTEKHPGGHRGEQLTGQVREQEKSESGIAPRQPLRERLTEHTAPFLATLLGVMEEVAWSVPVTWQVFDDTPRKDRSKARIIHGCLDDLAEHFESNNALGVGIFIAVNKTNQAGREKKDIVALRAAWTDIDDKKAEEQFDLSMIPLQPTMVVKSGHGSHIYWCFPEPIPCDQSRKLEHEALLSGIHGALKKFGADGQVCQVASVLRVPGFYNMKRDPILVELVQGHGPRHTPKEIAATYPPEHPRVPSQKAHRTSKLIEPPPILQIFHDLGVQVSPAKDLGDGISYRTGCPFGDRHTDGQDSDSGFLTLWPDGRPRYWKCRHEHCSNTSFEDILELARSRGIKVQVPRGQRPCPTILVLPPEVEVAEAGRKALATVPGVYARRGRLVHVHRHAGEKGKRTIPVGVVGIRDAAPAWIRERLSEAANFERQVRGAGGITRVPSLVPDWVGAMILEAPGQHFQELRAVTTAPVFLADGAIHNTPGALRDRVLYLGPESTSTVLDRPQQSDAQEAWHRLEAVVEDFPFAASPSQEVHRAAWLALLLTVVGRYAIDGPIPFALIEANSQAAGKGLLSQVTAIITTGSGAPVMGCPREEVELKKSILPVLMDATRIQVLDEIHAGFGGRAWNALVTATVYQDRLLGASAMVEVPNDTVWITTGNNAAFAPDTTRRCLPIRLEPMCERPEDRSEFKIRDLLGYVREHQADLLGDVLTILRAFHVAGRPESGLKPWGSFEGWSETIRDAVFWCTGFDCDTRQALAPAADLGRIIHLDLIEELHAAFGTNPFTTGTVMEKAAHLSGLHTAIEAACPSKDGKLRPVSIGKRFSSFRRRPVSGKMLDQHHVPDRKGGALWCIRFIDDQGTIHHIAPEGESASFQ